MSSQVIRMPVLTTSDSTFNPSALSTSPNPNRSVGTRYENVPHDGPGTAVYVPQPTRAELKANSAVLGSGASSRPFYVRDPEGKNFIDIDGKVVSPRWILYDPRGGEPDAKGCTCM